MTYASMICGICWQERMPLRHVGKKCWRQNIAHGVYPDLTLHTYPHISQANLDQSILT